MGYSPWSRKESDTTEQLTLFTFKKLNRTPPSPDLVKPHTKPWTFLTVPEELRLLPKHHREGCLRQAFHVKKDVKKIKKGQCQCAILGAKWCKLKLVWRKKKKKQARKNEVEVGCSLAGDTLPPSVRE